VRPIPYAWPFEKPDPVLQRSLDIALNYLEVTALTRPDGMTEVACARVILDEWLIGGGDSGIRSGWRTKPLSRSRLNSLCWGR
jgi:hypothetical protein